MSNQLQTVLWMAEELDFAPLTNKQRIQLDQKTRVFLGSVAASSLNHCLY